MTPSLTPAAGRRLRLMVLVTLLLGFGFIATVWISYLVSRDNIRHLIVEQELPLTSDTIYSEIQKDLVQPIFISSMMASDTFLRDWTLRGERNVEEIVKYLAEIKTRYGAVTSFFVSERSGAYYHPSGIARRIRADDPREAWYYRVRAMSEPYEINIDPDATNRDAMTIFINFRVFDYEHRFLGATGVGLAVDTVQRLVADYQTRYRRIVYFVDGQGRIVLPGTGPAVANIREVEGLAEQATNILSQHSGSYQYHHEGHTHLLNVRYVPELKWRLFVEKVEDEELGDIRKVLVFNLALCAAIMTAVLLSIHFYIARQQRAARASREETLRFISHDLRSPLTSIALLAEDGNGSGCPALLDRAGRYAKGALHLTDSLVQLMRAEATDRARFSEVDLAEAARDAADQAWAAAKAKGIQLRQDIDGEAWVDGDRSLLARALTNLLDNAIKYGPAGSQITLAIRREKNEWLASVTDQGDGIPGHKLARMFLPYQRDEEAIDPQVPGVGLGLAIVKAIAESHGGRVEVESQEGRGACFTLRLPAKG
ncbi:MAG: sensor histidine kinase [Deltaproteobacteria bacterium]|nr:sensor histidine kinase [Deltaproteobacteria bacterium]